MAAALVGAVVSVLAAAAEVVMTVAAVTAMGQQWRQW